MDILEHIANILKREVVKLIPEVAYHSSLQGGTAWDITFSRVDAEPFGNDVSFYIRTERRNAYIGLKYTTNRTGEPGDKRLFVRHNEFRFVIPANSIIDNDRLPARMESVLTEIRQAILLCDRYFIGEYIWVYPDMHFSSLVFDFENKNTIRSVFEFEFETEDGFKCKPSITMERDINITSILINGDSAVLSTDTSDEEKIKFNKAFNSPQRANIVTSLIELAKNNVLASRYNGLVNKSSTFLQIL